MSGSLGRFVPRLRQRDGDDCQLCGKPIDFSLAFPDDWSRTVDHVRPRAAGGRTHLGNLQLAHLRCNQLRGAAWDGEDHGAAHGERMAREANPNSKWNRKVAARRAAREAAHAKNPLAAYEAWSAAQDAWAGGGTKPESPCM